MQPEDNWTYIHQELQNLIRTSNLLNPLIENTEYGLALITPDYRVVEVNHKMREWFPETEIGAVPLCYTCLYHKGASPCPGCPAADCIREGKKTAAIIEVPAGQAETRLYGVNCTPLKGTDGTVWGILEIVENVTEQVKKERQLSEIEARYTQIMEYASDAIFTFDCSGVVLHLNKKAQQIFGYAAEEIQGKPVYVLIPEDLREQQQKAIQRIFQERTCSGQPSEGLGLRKDGTILPIEITYSLIDTASGNTLTAILRDISERKSHEVQLKTYTEKLQHEVAARTEELARSEERYRSLVNTANDAIISVSKEGSIIFVNKKAEELYGYTSQELFGRHISDITPSDAWQMIREQMQSGTEGAQGRMLESYGIRRDRKTFPVELTIGIFRRNNEYILTMIARDTSLRKGLEQELQQYTAKLEEKVRERTYELTASQQSLKEKISELSILQEIGEALASTMDLEAVVNIILVGATSHHGLGFNRAFLFLINDEGALLEGKVAIGPSDNAEAQKIWSEIIGKRLTLKEILQSYMNKTGQIDTYVNSIVKNIKIPLSAEDHIMIHVVKKRESLNVKDAYNNPLVPKSLLGIMNCNAFALIPLMAENTVLGLLWADNAITKNPIEDRDIERLRAFALNASLAIQKSNLYKNIQEKVMELDRANQELKENRDRLIRSEKLAAVGEMSATVAHGIRNPLVSIGGFARRLLKKETEDSSNKKYLQIIVDEIDRLETILTELLDFVRPRTLKLRSVCLNTMIESVLEVVSLELEKRTIRIDKKLMPELPQLELDPDQFKGILHNLFNNAMDAMPDGGTLKISTEVEAGWIKASIADTGVGIPDDAIEKVFHPFFTSKETGSGLGLAVCNQIVAIHGGHIKLRRQIPQGVIFDIYLPVSRDKTSPLEAP